MPDTHNSTGTDDRVRGGEGFPQENPDGSPALVGMSDYTRQLLRDRADKRNETVVGGNYADLQRIGEMLAGGPGAPTSVKDALGTPPGLDPKSDDVITGPQLSALRGEWDRESERAGLVEAPVAPTPPENKDVTSVDPTSVSPTVESKGSTSSTSQTQPQTQTPKKS